MSGYAEEHNIPAASLNTPNSGTSASHNRLDLSTFFSALDQVTTPSSNNAVPGAQHNPHNLPLPQNVSSVYRQLANAYQVMIGETEGVVTETRAAPHIHNSELLSGLIEMLMRNAEDPPREVHGLPEEFFAELDRVPKQKLKPEDVCPICGNPFLEDKYPLVVQLPCHPDHIFDLDCIKPWLKVNTTCPLDRKDLEKKKPTPIQREPVKDEYQEEEWDDMYA